MQKTIEQLNVRRIMVAFVMGCIVYLCMSVCVHAAKNSGKCGENLKWEISNGVLTITGSGDMTDYGDETAPWFEYAEDISVLNLPSKMTSIGDYAFYGCKNINNVILQESTIEIGAYAFAECSSLISINLGGVEKIKDGAFWQCYSLKTISFTDRLTEIGPEAFYRCEGIHALNVPATVEYIGPAAFAYCTELVRASVNAPLKKLPAWIFYGCINLSDVSLAAEIVEVGDYAFYDCDNLDKIYTQSKDDEIAEKIEKSIRDAESETSNGRVSTSDISDTSIAKSDDEDSFISTTVIQKEEVVVTVKKIREYKTEGNDKISQIISAVLEDGKGWSDVADVTEERLGESTIDSFTVEIQLLETIVNAEDLSLFAGKPIILKIITPNGVIWKIDMSEMTTESFSRVYDFGVSLSQRDDKKIASELIYQMNFSGHIDFNVTVGGKIGQIDNLASLYAKKGNSYDFINTVIIDHENYAWFSLAGVDKKTNYYIGINVDKIDYEDATIPETMYESIDSKENVTYLMDENGVQYRITGRSSRWGITGKQFAIYVAVAIGATVLIVGSVMLAFNIIKRSREKYEHLAEETALKEKEEEEALRMEIMKGLLEKSDDL